MAREPVVARDFLGLGTDNEEKSRYPTVTEQRSARDFNGAGESESSRSLLVLGLSSSPASGTRGLSAVPAAPWPSMTRKVEDLDKGDLARRAASAAAEEEKPLEDLTDADIEKLSKEDCVRYITRNRDKSRSASNIQVFSKPLSMAYRIGQGEEKPAIKWSPSLPRNGGPEASSSHTGAAVQHDVSGIPNAPVPKYYAQSQSGTADDVLGAARSSCGPPLESSLSLSMPSTREQPLVQSTGFGSPVPVGLRMLRPPEHPQRPLGNHSGHGSNQQVGTTSRILGQNHLPGRPPTAQLTIFYSGEVKVYDDVPADKAKAIMLLAGSGSSWSSNGGSPHPISGRPPSTGGIASSSSSPAISCSAPASVSALSQVATPVVAAGRIKQIGLPANHAELPQARKASLARFLEKRKDRVRGKAPYVPPNFSPKKDTGSSTPPRENSPSPSKTGKSPSPVKVIPVMIPRNRSPSPAQRPGSSSHPNGNPPLARRATTPQQALQLTSIGQTSVAQTGAPQRSSMEDRMDWRSQLPRVPFQEQKPEPIEEDRSR